MNKFKIGAKVRCIKEDVYGLEHNKIYEIETIHPVYNSLYLKGKLNHYDTDCFVLVESSPSTVNDIAKAKENLEKELLAFIDSKVQAFQDDFPDVEMESVSIDVQTLRLIDRKIPRLLVVKAPVRIVL